MKYPKPEDVRSTSHAEARHYNERYYFTGKPCKYGHVSIRHRTGGCVECHKTESALQWNSRHWIVKCQPVPMEIEGELEREDTQRMNELLPKFADAIFALSRVKEEYRRRDAIAALTLIAQEYMDRRTK